MGSLHSVSFPASSFAFFCFPFLSIIFHKFGYMHLLLFLSLFMVFPFIELSIILFHFSLGMLFMLQ